MSTTGQSDSIKTEGVPVSVSADNDPATPAFRSPTRTSQVGLQFTSGDELDRAIDWLWSTPELRDLPRVHVGQHTMIVPEETVELFRRNGHSFHVCAVVSAGDLPPQEVNRIRREG